MKTVSVAAVTYFLVTAAASAQAPSVDALYGIWTHDTVSTLWSAGYTRPLMGPADYGLAIAHLDDHRSLVDRTQTGLEGSIGIGRDGSGLYLLGAGGIAMRHDDGNLDAFWSAGAGVSFRVLSILGVGIEARYRVEDAANRGFWNLAPTERRGLQLMGRVSLLFGGKAVPGGRMPPTRSLAAAARKRGISRSELAAQVVATAVDAMGTPYRWGGEGTNGYDCSGLIQYAYGAHGISLPRISRDQAASGLAVDRAVQALAPGDILGFAAEGGRVTHVGLYIGEGQFIHSAGSGVRVSSLSAGDPDSVWWQRRWTAARRILD